MKKAPSAQQLYRNYRRDLRELDRRLLSSDKKSSRFYMPLLLVMLTVIYIIDEITSNVNSMIQSEVVNEFFVVARGLDYNKGLATYSAMGMPLYAVMVFAPFYKSLADRFGRKLFLIINCFGMALGMLCCMLAQNIFLYYVGMVIIYFFIPNDMQVMYIMECAPVKHRAKLCAMLKSVALLGVMLIPVLRNAFMGNDGTLWREIYLVPIIIAAAVGLSAVFLLRETPIFLDQRIAYLKLSERERAEKAEAEKKEKENNNGGVVPALKFIFKHKQTRAIAICAIIFIFSAGVTNYYESIMKTSGNMTTESITYALYFITGFNALVTTAGGFVSDLFGRKKAAVCLSSLAFIGLTLFVVASNLGWSPAAVGICYGCFIGGLWSVSDMLCLILPSESTPTHLRASVVGTMSLVSSVGVILSSVIITVGMLLVKNLGWLCLGVSAPFMLAAIIVLSLKVHETKGIDLNTVTGCEWD